MADLIIQFNGADAATSYTAETGQTVTFAGTAQLDTADKKNGLSSLLLDGNSDYVTIPQESGFEFGSGDFTIDTWVNLSNVPSGGNYEMIATYGGADAWYLGFYTSGGTRLQFLSSTGTMNLDAVVSLSTSTWHHVAIVRDGSTLTGYFDGVSFATDSTLGTIPAETDDLVLGAWIVSDLKWYLDGYIDNFRITKGSALWTANFTPPSPDAYFQAKLNDNAANTTVTDDGPGGNTGALEGGDNTSTVSDNTVKVIDRAFHLNGTDDSVSIDAMVADVKNDTAGSISMWVYNDDASDNAYYFSVSDASALYSRFMITCAGDDIVRAQFSDAAGDAQWVWTGPTLSSATWYHIVLVQNGTSPVMYVNGTTSGGSLTTSVDATYWFSDESGVLDVGRIGSLKYNSTEIAFHDGRVDDTRYFKNIGLTQQDVDNIYNKGSGTEDDPAPYVAASTPRSQAIIIS